MVKKDANSEGQPGPPPDETTSAIGHNSANAENVSDEKISELIGEAQQKVKSYDHAEVACVSALARASHEGIVATYALILAIMENGGLLEFYRARGVPAHGNTKNPCSPLVAYLFRHYDRFYTRQTIWRWAAVLYVARYKKISLHALPDFLEKYGLDAIAADYKQLRNGGEPTHDVPNDKLAESITVGKSEQTSIPATPLTATLKGKILAVIDCEPDLHNWHIVAVLRHSQEQVEKVMAADARRRLSADK
jgi:hypothetical protein